MDSTSNFAHVSSAEESLLSSERSLSSRGSLGGLADPRGARVRGAVGAFALEAPAQHLLAVDEPQALAGYLLGRFLRQAEHPVVPPRLGRVVGDVHAQGVEDAEELRLVARRGLGERDAGADVADPRVAAERMISFSARPR